MNFENIFILPNVIGDRSRRRFGGIFIKIPKVTSAWSSLVGRLPLLSLSESVVRDFLWLGLPSHHTDSLLLDLLLGLKFETLSSCWKNALFCKVLPSL